MRDGASHAPMRIQGEAEGQGLCEDRRLLRVFEDMFRLWASVADAEFCDLRLEMPACSS